LLDNKILVIYAITLYWMFSRIHTQKTLLRFAVDTANRAINGTKENRKRRSLLERIVYRAEADFFALSFRSFFSMCPWENCLLRTRCKCWLLY